MLSNASRDERFYAPVAPARGRARRVAVASALFVGAALLIGTVAHAAHNAHHEHAISTASR
jgi:hypothetical protein